VTKRRVEWEVDAVGEELLGTLTPDERLQLWIEAQAAGRETWVIELVGTCPTHIYRGADPAFRRRAELLLVLGAQARYELHTTLLTFEHTTTVQQLQRVIEYHADGEPSDDELKAARDRADQLALSFASLHVTYYAYRRFASEAFDFILLRRCFL
jgi:hypothetical protein